MIRTPESLRGMLEAHLLKRELKDSTEKWYRRVVSVFCTWYGRPDVPADDLTPECVNRFLQDKQHANCSSWYRKSLKTGIKSIAGPHLSGQQLRRIKLSPLSVHSWSAADVVRLIGCSHVVPAWHRGFMERSIEVAFCTGLSQIDLHRLSRSEHVSHDGSVRVRRSKTGEEAVVYIPPEVLDALPRRGALLPLPFSREMFRRYFNPMVATAGLVGTFKTLRVSSGMEAELLTGRGHEHLANSRKVFERHYLDRTRVERKPVILRLPK